LGRRRVEEQDGVIFQQGDAADGFYVVLQGRVKIVTTGTNAATQVLSAVAASSVTVAVV